MRPVKSSLRVGREVVLDEGVKAGETVVTDGQLRLSPGAKVEVKAAAAPEPSAPGNSAP
jgi:multidrug efflux system membrane fusion protein